MSLISHRFLPFIRLIFITLFLIAPAFAFSEAGNFILRTYTPKAYLASPQNWAVLEDTRGVMYFGNTDGLLEFDGVTWRRIALPNSKAVRSLALNTKGTVYVGGQNEIGMLAPDQSGAMRFVSLLDKIDPAERSFGDVWSIIVTAEGVYFSTTEKLILYNPGSGVRLWKAAGRFRRAFLINGALHVHVTNVGLHRLNGENLELVPGGDTISGADVRGVFQSSFGTTLVTNKGFFVKTATGLEQVQFPIEKLTQEASIYSVNQISTDLVAFGGTRGGLILSTSDGRLIRALTKETGLPSEYIAAINMDRQGGVWLATSNGIVRFTPRLTLFNESSGFSGALICLTRWQGVLHIGTTTGLFRLKPGIDGAPPQFEAVAGIQEPIWSLLARGTSLWIGGQTGLYEFDGKTVHQRNAFKDLVYDISFSRNDPNTLFVAMRTAAHIMTFDGEAWNKTAEIPGQGEEFRAILDDDEGIVWATTRASIVKADLHSSSPTIQTFTKEHGLPKGWKNAYRIGGRILFTTEKGLMKLDKASARFVPDPVLGTRFSDGTLGILQTKEDPRNGNVWISGSGYHGLLAKPFTPEADWRPMPFIAAGFEELWNIHPDDDGTVWAVGSDGTLARLEPGLGSAQLRPLEVLIRRLLTSDTRQFISEGATKTPITILPSMSNLRLEFSAPFFDAPDRVEYQLALDGPIDAKTPWSSEAWKDLSNLWDGEHRLRIRARNPYGQLSPEVSVFLEVLPPWYRTFWAYAVYATVFVGLIWVVFRWRLRSLKESNRRLELIVEDRTAEIRHQRDQILDQEKKTEALLLNILPESVAAELRTNGSVAPMRFDDVTVCFTDFVGFTLSSEKIRAEDLVEKLHEYFTEFDNIITKYGLEKLKTIGDSYMFVSGLPQPIENHAEVAVMAALEIVEMSKALGLKNPDLNWRLRVGLHSGPVVAGVVGFKKFAFDIWGDTVNLASRMESSGSPNRVNLSERTYLEVKDRFDCEDRGLVRTKDGRDLHMYFASGYKIRLEPSRATMV